MSRPHPVTVAVAALVAGVAALWNALHLRRLLEVHLNDFGRFWYGAKAWLAGGSLYEPSVATPVDLGDGALIELWNLGAPAFHLLVLPLAALQETGAIAVWLGVGLLALGWSARVIVDELKLQPTAAHGVLVAAAFLAFAGTTAQVVTGQVAWLLLAPITAAWRAWRRGLWVRAGVILGLLTAIKPLFAVFLPWLLVRRAWRGAGAFAGAAATGLGAGAVVFGPESYPAWKARLDAVTWSWLPMNGSLHGTLTRLLTDNPVFTPLAQAPELVTPLWLGLGGLVAVATYAVAWRGPVDEDRGFGLVLLMALVISPLAWVYYHLLLVPPLLAVAQRRRLPRVVWAGLALAFAMPFAATRLFRDAPLLVVTLGAPYLWGTLALWAWLAVGGPLRTERD